MIITKTVTYRNKEINISKLRHQSSIKILVECPVCKQQRMAEYFRVKDNQICHLCALQKLAKHIPVGFRSGRYIVISNGSRNGRSLCKCDCGTVREVDNCVLTSGHSKSCGCYKKEVVSEIGKRMTRGWIRENHPNWKGGISGERELHEARKETKEWKKKVYERDNYTCQCCGQKGYKLNAHHIKSYAENSELRLEIKNGITLCLECHTKFHKQFGRKKINHEMLNEFIKKAA